MLVNHCLGVQGRIEPPPYGLREKIMSKLNRNKSTKNRFPYMHHYTSEPVVYYWLLLKGFLRLTYASAFSSISLLLAFLFLRSQFSISDFLKYSLPSLGL